ncbi:50S ribosomal protein L28 [Bienertia sinuspersici]
MYIGMRAKGAKEASCEDKPRREEKRRLMRNNQRPEEYIDPEPEQREETIADLAQFFQFTFNPLLEGDFEMTDENRTPPPPVRSLRDYSQPSAASMAGGYSVPDTDAANFELKPALANMVERSQFAGTLKEDPNLHLQNFLQYCDTIKQQNVTKVYIRRRMFPFSLKDKARTWLNDLNMDTITSWEDLALAFQRKYYPPQRTTLLRSQITNFNQETDEPLYEAWERFKELLRLCPHHGLEKWFLVQSFYNGLGNESRALLDSAVNGRFMNQEVNAAYDLIEEITTHNSQFGNLRGHSKRGGKHVVDDKYESLASQINAISQKLDKIGTSSSQPMSVAAMAALSGASESFCDSCGSFGHNSQSCHSSMEQVCAFQAYKNNPFSNTYNPGYKDHPYFSYRSNNVQNPHPMPQLPAPQQQQQMQRFQPQGPSQPPGFTRPPFNPAPPQQNSEIAELKNMMTQMQKNLEAMQTHNKHLET